MFLELTQQTEAWRIARDVQREHEQYIKDNEGIHCGGTETPEMRKANEAFEMKMFGKVSPRHDKTVTPVTTFHTANHVNIESKQYDVSF